MSIIKHISPRSKLLLLTEARNRVLKLKDKDRMKEEAEASLAAFVRLMWRFVEPARPLVEGWPLDAICEHLEAVSAGEITRLLINVPPGFMKSLVANVFWPAWEWIEWPWLRYISASYSAGLTVRDNSRLRNILLSPTYQEFWGDKFGPKMGGLYNVTKLENDKTGWKLATSVEGLGTGERGDRFVIDDGNSVKQAESPTVTKSTNQWFQEVVPTRLNDQAKSVIINIQQRTSEIDISGVILDPANGFGEYVHLMIPMEYEPDRHCVTPIGWEDPRGADPETRMENAGALAWPARFSRVTVERDKKILGEFGTSGQFQQRPAPRGGGIFKREHWREWPPLDWAPAKRMEKIQFPPIEYVVASLDTALGEKDESDYSALTIWGIWRGASDGDKLKLPPRIVVDPQGDFMRLEDAERPKCMLLYGWQKRLRLHGPTEILPPEMTKAEWNSPARLAERQKKWGLVQWVVYHCRMFRADTLLIEVKANGKDVADELERLHKDEDWGTVLVDPGRFDKVSRAYALQHLFENGVIYAPLAYSIEDDRWDYPAWAAPIIDQFSIFPRGKHDDMVDSGMHALKYIRDLGLLIRSDEAEKEYDRSLEYPRRAQALYDS